MSIVNILFYLLAGMVVLSAVLVVTLRNLVRSVFVFFITLFALAGLYVFTLADFIAVTQVVVYVGGVLVLMLFALMLSSREGLNALQTGEDASLVKKISAAVLAIGFLIVLLRILPGENSLPAWMIDTAQPAENTVKQLGVQLMTTYLLPFEVISVFLLMALIGAAHLARKEGSRL